MTRLLSEDDTRIDKHTTELSFNINIYDDAHINDIISNIKSLNGDTESIIAQLHIEDFGYKEKLLLHLLSSDTAKYLTKSLNEFFARNELDKIDINTPQILCIHNLLKEIISDNDIDIYNYLADNGLLYISKYRSVIEKKDRPIYEHIYIPYSDSTLSNIIMSSIPANKIPDVKDINPLYAYMLLYLINQDFIDSISDGRGHRESLYMVSSSLYRTLLSNKDEGIRKLYLMFPVKFYIHRAELTYYYILENRDYLLKQEIPKVIYIDGYNNVDDIPSLDFTYEQCMFIYNNLEKEVAIELNPFFAVLLSSSNITDIPEFTHIFMVLGMSRLGNLEPIFNINSKYLYSIIARSIHRNKMSYDSRSIHHIGNAMKHAFIDFYKHYYMQESKDSGGIKPLTPSYDGKYLSLAIEFFTILLYLYKNADKIIEILKSSESVEDRMERILEVMEESYIRDWTELYAKHNKTYTEQPSMKFNILDINNIIEFKIIKTWDVLKSYDIRYDSTIDCFVNWNKFSRLTYEESDFNITTYSNYPFTIDTINSRRLITKMLGDIYIRYKNSNYYKSLSDIERAEISYIFQILHHSIQYTGDSMDKLFRAIILLNTYLQEIEK